MLDGELKLDEMEQDILGSYERGEWRSIPNLAEEMAQNRAIAAATLRKDKRVNIRISSRDLEALQKRAIAEGLPYQTLISSLIHKFVSGRLTGF